MKNNGSWSDRRCKSSRLVSMGIGAFDIRTSKEILGVLLLPYYF